MRQNALLSSANFTEYAVLPLFLPLARSTPYETPNQTLDIGLQTTDLIVYEIKPCSPHRPS
jgi:hypothetical protein